MNASLSVAKKINNNADIIYVFLADGNYKSVKIDSQTTVKRIIKVVLNGLEIDKISFGRFALRLNSYNSAAVGSHIDENHWLHPSLKIPQIWRRYVNNDFSKKNMRFELRIRFLSSNFHEMYQTEMIAFLYLFEQLKADYLRYIVWKIDSKKALDIAALLIRKRFSHLTNANLEKKLDFSLIEQEGGLVKYLPEVMIRKHLQKLIIALVRKIILLTEVECIFSFMKILSEITPFNVEVFCASLSSKWENPVNVHIGYDLGIAYFSEQTRLLTQITPLKCITEVSVHRLNLTPNTKSLVKLRVSESQAFLTFTLPTLNIAESFAHLIDGYRSFIYGFVSQNNNDEKSIWQFNYFLDDKPQSLSNYCIFFSNEKLNNLNNNSQKKNNDQIISKVNKYYIGETNFSEKKINYFNSHSQNHFYNDNINSMICDLNIEMRLILLEELLGDGQFGNVFKGAYKFDANKPSLLVAVKVCKTENEFDDINLANKYLLEEAYIMSQFRHLHIIKLIGICSIGPPTVWIVMELAELGELRSYLQREKTSIDLRIQIIFAYQIASALSYLHDRQYLHRDVAARNCLVSNPYCVKLSDFGLSRRIDKFEDIYIASQGKLPIKWMSPESINFRKFTLLSDVYMFGVCIWEILMYGVKPWQGVRNQDIILRIEKGERLRRPDCCPKSLYEFLITMWSIEPYDRPTMLDTKQFMEHLLKQIDCNIPYNKLEASHEYLNSKKIKKMSKELNNNNQLFILNKNISTCRRSSSASAIESNSEKLIHSKLCLALEQQRAQCDEDDKWLIEEEQKLLPFTTHNSRHCLAKNLCLKNTIGKFSTSPSSNGTTSSNLTKSKRIGNIAYELKDSLKSFENLTSSKIDLDRTNDLIYNIVVNLIQKISKLSKNYIQTMLKIKLIEDIEEIEYEAKLLLMESSTILKDINKLDQKQIMLMQTLVKSDLCNLNKALNNLKLESTDYDLHFHNFNQREILQMINLLAVNSKNLFDSVDLARLNSGTVQFKQLS